MSYSLTLELLNEAALARAQTQNEVVFRWGRAPPGTTLNARVFTFILSAASKSLCGL
jgi:hypothetical protein